MNKWETKKLEEVVLFNPKESIKKGSTAKKIAMDVLKPFYRDIPSFELTEYNGGTKFRNGDTIMARITPCLENGKIAKVSILNDDEVGFGSTEYIVFRSINGITDENYVYYLICSPFIREPAIKSMVGSSGRQRVQTDVLQNLEISIPDLETQYKIGSLLKSIDDKILSNTAINENLEQQAQMIFEKEIINSTNKIKNGVIGDYCTIKSGYAFKSSWWKNNGVQVIKIKNIDNDTLNLSDCSCVTFDKIEIAKEFLVAGGDILIAMTGATIGKFAVVPKYDKPLLVNQRVGKFFLGENPVEKLPFLFCTLKLSDIITEIINRSQGSAQPNISASDIMATPCYIPNKDIILSFNKTCKPLFESIINRQYENQRLAALRDSLLPKLMNGEIDVSDVKI